MVKTDPQAQLKIDKKEKRARPYRQMQLQRFSVRFIYSSSYGIDIPLSGKVFFFLFNVFGNDDRLDSLNSLFVQPYARRRTFRTIGKLPEGV